MYFLEIVVFCDETPCNLASNCKLLRRISSVQKVEAYGSVFIVRLFSEVHKMHDGVAVLH